MSFELTNTPVTFMDLINRLFRDYLEAFVIFVINDTITLTDIDHMS